VNDLFVSGPEPPVIGQSPALEINGLTQIFPRAKREPFTALRDVTLSAYDGEFVSVVGPTGCGKSTMLSAISGLRRPSAGQIRIAGTPVTGVRRDVGLILQQDALLPWRTAQQNVALGLRYRGVSRREANERARDWLIRVGLVGFEHAYPHQLSGGMRKRTMIAATLACRPRLLLMDEPFSALDVQTRHIMENDLLGLWQQAGNQTVFFITHDLEEAIGLSDRVIVITSSPGTVLGEYKIDLPRPRNLQEVKLEPAFVEIYRSIWHDLGREVAKAARPAASGNA
jgi:NitT/TauT family transport system ATP-binding protein